MGIETLAIAGIAAGVLGAGVSAIGAMQQGQAAQAQANYSAAVAGVNQQIAAENAKQAQAAGNVEAQNSMLRTRALIGTQLAEQASSGLDVNSGSPAKVRQSTEILGNLDAMTIQHNASRAAYGYQAQGVGYQAQAALDKLQGEQAAQAGMFGAASSILSGATSLTGNYLKFQQSGIFSGSGSGSAGGLY